MHLIVSSKTLSLRLQLLQMNIGRMLSRGGGIIHTWNSMFIFLAWLSKRSPQVCIKKGFEWKKAPPWQSPGFVAKIFPWLARVDYLARSMNLGLSFEFHVVWKELWVRERERESKWHEITYTCIWIFEKGRENKWVYTVTGLLCNVQRKKISF